MPTQHGARLVFDNARKLISDAGFSVNQAVLSQSYLRSEVLISTTVTSYHIPVLANDVQNGATAYPTEFRLNLQDAFILSGLSVSFAIPATETATNFKLFSYPDAAALTTTGAAAAMYNLYNGFMSVVINNRQIVPALDLYRFLSVPQTQQNTQPGGNTGIDQYEGSYTSFFPIEPNLVLVGSKNNQITLTLPNAISVLQASTTPKIVVRFYGILGQNITPVR